MLFPCERHTKADLALWRNLERADFAHWKRLEASGRVVATVETIRRFCDDGPAYCGVSWGKDSTVLAHLVREASPATPIAWVRVEPIGNPDCGVVRDAFQVGWPGQQYHEVSVQCERDSAGWHATGTLEAGFDAIAERTGTARYLSGVRSDESGARTLRCRLHGTTTKNTCAPLAFWTTADVFAYLAHFELPVHPAYACSGGGRWPRERLRTASLGGQRGAGGGRAEWEREYYGAELRRLEMR